MTKFAAFVRPAALALAAAVTLSQTPAHAALSYLSEIDIANAGWSAIEYVALSDDFGMTWTDNMLWGWDLPAGYYETMQVDVSWNCLFDIFIAYDTGVEVFLEDVDMCSAVMIEAFEEGALVTDESGEAYEIYDAGFDY